VIFCDIKYAIKKDQIVEFQSSDGLFGGGMNRLSKSLGGTFACYFLGLKHFLSKNNITITPPSNKQNKA
jgi:hypothetical protein